jgi:hypothetical protein
MKNVSSKETSNAQFHKQFQQVTLGFKHIFASSCRTARQLPVFEIKPMTASKILKKIEREAPEYNNYESKKVSIDFDIKNLKNSLSGQFKTKRDKCIILTIRKMAIPVGKALITPDSIVFVNYFEKNYLAGDFSDIKKLVGIDLDYNLIQALLTADISKMLQDESFDKEVISVIDSQMYRIDSRFNPRIDRALTTGNEKRLNRYMKRMDDSEFIDYSIWVDPQYFVIRKVTLNDIKYKKNITISYNQYELVGRSLFPQEVSFDLFSPTEKFSILLKLSKSSVNTDNDFSFSIPEKFEELK